MLSGLRDRTFGTERTVLFLYGLLVVLPALVFGVLLWQQITTDHERRLEEVPTDAVDAASRILGALERRFEDLLESEQDRPFFHYQQDMYAGEATTGIIPFEASPLYIGPDRPEGIAAWFSFDALEQFGEIAMFYGGNDITVDHEEIKNNHVDLITETIAGEFASRPATMIHSEINRLLETDDAEQRLRPIPHVAVNLHQGREPNCIADDLAHIRELQDETIAVNVMPFMIRVVRAGDGRRWIIVARKIHIPAYETDVELPDCFEVLEYMTYDVQGFLVDPDWLLVDLPGEIASDALGQSQQLLVKNYPAASIGEGHAVQEVQLFDRFEEVMFDYPADRDLGLMRVAVNEGRMRHNFRRQLFWFGGVAIVMIVSLIIGLRLLLGSIRASQEQARRTENFVASVTHELRTPVATVKLFGEMLKDGWVTDEEKRQEYLTRIVREANRLDTLVDRVLEKRRLGVGAPEPRPGDLNEEIVKQESELLLNRGTEEEDLVFELARDLPPVLLTAEGVHAILVNLVENARKYAPVDSQAPGAEPIRVLTRLNRKGRAVLEVLDRGPGIPDGERTKVFGAFYRLGDEATRTTVGTGLGLHLVSLTARSLGARAQALPRPGGGTAFRVTFKTLKPGALA
ncbi:MAG: hypothetical protein GY711_14325 [bacterium]|nr:hypothetical protein [bacterium]